MNENQNTKTNKNSADEGLASACCSPLRAEDIWYNLEGEKSKANHVTVEMTIFCSRCSEWYREIVPHDRSRSDFINDILTSEHMDWEKHGKHVLCHECVSYLKQQGKL